MTTEPVQPDERIPSAGTALQETTPIQHRVASVTFDHCACGWISEGQTSSWPATHSGREHEHTP